ncbi:MAG: hypothetical protein WKG00_28890 [Polyangiaceae bacterium]
MALTTALLPAVAFAQDSGGAWFPPSPVPPPPAVPAPPPPVPAAPFPGPAAAPLQAGGPNVVTYPDGSASVTRTPAGGVDVHAPTPSGTVHALGCDRVDVDARSRVAAAGSPCAAYWYPYPVYPPYPYPYAYAYPPPRPPRPQPPPDPARTGALIASSLVFGLGTLAAGSAFVASASEPQYDFCNPDGSGACGRHEPNKAALYAMGAFLTLPPSVPRFVVGDVGTALLLTSLRGGSFALGAFVDWDDDSQMVPVTLAFVAPLTLGIVDLATTPRRYKAEDTKRHSDSAALQPELRSIGPTATVGARGSLLPALGASGVF